jgi:light-independent protochlorophyllide reductase subunit B
MPAEAAVATQGGQVIWLSDAENELKKIPFFVRGKARRNTEKFAEIKGVTAISAETLYEAKAHYAR